MAITPIVIWVAYPLVIFFGLTYFSPRYVALMLAILLVIKWRRDAVMWLNSLAKVNLIIFLGLFALIAFTFVFDSEYLLRLYPAFVNLGMLILFTASLKFPPNIIESFARISTPDLSDDGVRYTHVVTYVWCVFFIVNGLISLYTAYYSTQAIWALYNGLIAYVLIGVLFGCEWIVRQRYMSKPHPDKSC